MPMPMSVANWVNSWVLWWSGVVSLSVHLWQDPLFYHSTVLCTRVSIFINLGCPLSVMSEITCSRPYYPVPVVRTVPEITSLGLLRSFYIQYIQEASTSKDSIWYNYLCSADWSAPQVPIRSLSTKVKLSGQLKALCILHVGHQWQSGCVVPVRRSPGFHDRIFVR